MSLSRIPNNEGKTVSTTQQKELTVDLLNEYHDKMINEIEERMRKIMLIQLLQQPHDSLFNIGCECLEYASGDGSGDIRQDILHELMAEKVIEISDDYLHVQRIRRRPEQREEEWFELEKKFPAFKEIMMLNDRHLPRKFKEMMHETPTAELINSAAAMKELEDAILD
jgi:hypothetical protein